MHIICPHCRNAIEVVEVNVREEIVCPSCGSSFQLEGGSTKGTSLPDGTKTLDRFTLLATVGQGAFGTVYKARDPDLDRTVAIKVPRAGNIASDQERDRFLREARSVAQLRHPSIVSVHEVGQVSNLPYLVSDFVEGITLADLLTSRRPPFRESAELIAQVADALQYAHSMGVVHRDVKPSNIMLENQTQITQMNADSSLRKSAQSAFTSFHPRLMDFGLAKRDAGEITMTIEGQVLGTPAYMSPEQARGEGHRVDGRSDVYSLGVILYELLTGELPFRGNTRMLLHQVLHDEPRSPRSLNDRIPRDLETICLKAMAKETSRRFHTAGALAEDLRRWLKGEPIMARPVGRVEKAWRWCRREPVVAGLTAAVAGVLLIGTLVSVGFAQYARLKADDEGQARSDSDQAKLKALASAAMSKKNEDLANERADDALAAVEQIQIANGLREADSGQVFAALRWFALPLVGEGARTPRAEKYRNRLSNYWRLSQDSSASCFLLTHALSHQGFVRHAAFSPDGRRVVTASADRTARVWDAATGLSVGPPLWHQHIVIHAAFSPDGCHVVTASFDKTARVWDAATGLPAGPPLQHDTSVDHAAFSPDGRRVVTVSLDQTARLWDAASGQPVGPLLSHEGRVVHATFSPDGLRVVTARSKTAQVWDAATGKPVGPPLQHQENVRRAAFSLDGHRVVTSCQKTAQVWNAATGRPVGSPLQHQDTVRHAAFSPDGRRVVTASEDQTARVWDAATGQAVSPRLQHNDTVAHAAFSPDGRRVVTGGYDRIARVWNAATGQPIGPPLPHSGSLVHVAFSPDGRRVITASGSAARVWDAATGQPAGPQLQHKDGVTHAEFNADGRRVVTASLDKTARLWDAATGEATCPPLLHQGGLRHAVFSSDGRQVVTASFQGAVRLWDAATGQAAGPSLPDQASVVHAAFSSDGRRIVTASGSIVQTWDAATGKPAGRPLPHQGSVFRAAFSSDGRCVVIAGGELGEPRVWNAATGLPAGPALLLQGPMSQAALSPDGCRVVTISGTAAQVWDASTGQPAGAPLRHQGFVTHAVFSPDGRHVVTASNDNTARVWDAATGQPAGPPLPHHARVRRAAFSPDGRRVVTVSGSAAQVWDGFTQQPAGPPLSHKGVVVHASFSPDGCRVVTASEDKTARVWDVSTDERPAEDWVRLTQFFAGELDRFGAHTPLSPERMKADWEYLRAKYPQDFTVTPAQARAWREQQIADSMREGNWAAVEFHRNWLIAELVTARGTKKLGRQSPLDGQPGFRVGWAVPRSSQGGIAMARTAARPAATLSKQLQPLRKNCPACGKRMWADYDNYRTVATLDGRVGLTLHIRRCPQPTCAFYRRPYRPEAEGRYALPQHEFGLDVIALVGALRYAEHRSVPEIHQHLVGRGLSICERTVTNLLDRYDELLAVSLTDDTRLQKLLAEQGRVILAIDGLQPDVGHEVLWVLRDCLSGEVLLAKSLLSARQVDLATLLTQVRDHVVVPIVAVVSDGQTSIRKAVAKALPDVPHQLCHFHYLREAARPIYEADRHAKKELKKHVRGVRAIERTVEGRTDAEAEVIRGYCSAVRSALTDDGRPPLKASGLQLQARLSAIVTSVGVAAEKRGRCRRNWSGSRTCSTRA